MKHWFFTLAAVFLSLINDTSAKKWVGPAARVLSKGGKGSCALSTNAFCELAGEVASGSESCSEYEDFEYCPTQEDVCDPSFTVESFCQSDGKSACSADCELAVNACCEISCCEETCLEEEQVCDLLDSFSCPDINFEICPCGEDERTTTEYCEDLVGEEGCETACEAYVNDCCSLCTSFLRSVWINEFHYNENGNMPNNGDDDEEYVELAFTNSVDIAGYQLLAFNGQMTGGQQPNSLPYEVITIPATPLVNAMSGVNFLRVDFNLLEDGGGGAGDQFHDGIALVDPDGNVVEFICYGLDSNISGGTAVLTRLINGISVSCTPLPITITETGATPQPNSLQRTTTTGGPGCSAADFTWTGPALESPGAINIGQMVDCTINCMV